MGTRPSIDCGLVGYCCCCSTVVVVVLSVQPSLRGSGRWPPRRHEVPFRSEISGGCSGMVGLACLPLSILTVLVCCSLGSVISWTTPARPASVFGSSSLVMSRQRSSGGSSVVCLRGSVGICLPGTRATLPLAILWLALLEEEVEEEEGHWYGSFVASVVVVRCQDRLRLASRPRLILCVRDRSRGMDVREILPMGSAPSQQARKRKKCRGWGGGGGQGQGVVWYDCRTGPDQAARSTPALPPLSI